MAKDRLLVVDDNEMNQRLMRVLLEAEGFEVRIAGDAMEAMPRAATPVAAAPRRGGFLSLIGGWPSMAGLVTATVAGVGIGFASPEAITDYALGTGYSTVGLNAGYGGLLGEATGFAVGEDDG